MIRGVQKFLMVAAVCSSGPGLAQECRDIGDAAARLSCFDRSTAPKKGSPKAASTTAVVVTPEQEALGKATLQAFLAAGTDYDAYAVKRGKGISLFVIGYLNRASVYQVITKLNLMEKARAAKFNTVEFSGKGGGGVWIFDLSAKPSCSDSICF